MTTKNEYRRLLLKSAVGAATAACLPNLAQAASLPVRLEWQQFKLTPQYQSFLGAIASMRANTNANDRSSLQFWADVHLHQCPHGAPYFISWHRGYLFYFEQQLRLISGDPLLNVPYWDYYSYATLPAEFTNPAPSNPLYLPRMSANVHGALDLAPFAPGVFNFQHGTVNAFEPKIEDVHNPIHDLIGGVMSTMLSPLDPIFYLHHGNIDRLTHAWAYPDGKGIPFSAWPYSPTNSDPYWAGDNVYSADLSMPRYQTLDPNWMGIDYADIAVPTSLPPAPAARPAVSLQRPPFRAFPSAPRRYISATRRSLGGVLQPLFDEQSVSIRLRLEKKDATQVARIVAARAASETGKETGKDSRGAIKAVIDKAVISSAAAQRGGFFYALYVNLPDTVDAQAARERWFVGTVGAFQIAAASHHGAAKVEFDITGALARQKATDFSELTLSWLRVDGDKPPAGKTIGVDEVRIDLATDAQFIEPLQLPKPQGWYGRGVAGPALSSAGR